MKSAEFAQRLTQIQAEIDLVLQNSLRNRAGLTLIAVTKRQPLSHVMLAYKAGLRDFGENQIQEGVPKVKSAPPDVVWHFIGHLQRNKVREAVKNFHSIHSVDSNKLLERIDSISGEERLCPEIFLQVNLLHDVDKHGYHPDHVKDALRLALSMRNVTCVGLMGIPPLHLDDSALCQFFKGMAELKNELQLAFPDWPGKLSMGMSSDFVPAIQAGSNYVRIGSALFGERDT
ncbi:MAG: YggS family pyridoxal phosphate-dependent enzyme [Acidobacteria bacterium]|nr:YggS family pyridoxal phosphate-dependent enzyme [Acidobacteriota bacterium]MCB9398201.1 YggS family pyridoxal phosphate-dependent enzyme [Acidobacteriota bacterium]